MVYGVIGLFANDKHRACKKPPAALSQNTLSRKHDFTNYAVALLQHYITCHRANTILQNTPLRYYHFAQHAVTLTELCTARRRANTTWNNRCMPSR